MSEDADPLATLFSQSYIAFLPSKIEQYHAVVTLDGKQQARQRLTSKFTVKPPTLMQSRHYAYLNDELLNPFEVDKLEGELRMHFLPEEAFSKVESAGILLFNEPGRPPVPAKHWLALELFLPERYFDRLTNTKLIACRLQGFFVERPLSETSNAYHWRDALRKSLTVLDAEFSNTIPDR